jgi:hypothetical protein
MPMQLKNKAHPLFYIYLRIFFSTYTGNKTFKTTGNIEDINTIDHSGYDKIYLNVDEGNNNNITLEEFFIINSYSDMFLDKGNDIFKKNDSRYISPDDCEKDYIYLIQFKENNKQNIKFFVKRAEKRIEWNEVKINEKTKIMLMASLFLIETDHGNVFVSEIKSTLSMKNAFSGVFDYLDKDIAYMLNEMFRILRDFEKEIRNDIDTLFVRQTAEVERILLSEICDLKMSNSLKRLKNRKNKRLSKSEYMEKTNALSTFTKNNFSIFKAFDNSLKKYDSLKKFIKKWDRKLLLFKNTSQNELSQLVMLSLTEIGENYARQIADGDNPYLIALVNVNKIYTLLRDFFTERVVLLCLKEHSDDAEKNFCSCDCLNKLRYFCCFIIILYVFLIYKKNVFF